MSRRFASAVRPILAALLVITGPAALAVSVVFSGGDPSASIGTNSLSQSAGGVTMTMRGYQVEIDSGGNETVFGPAPTSNGAGREVLNFDPRNLGEPGIGFVALPAPGFAITESDLPGGGLIIPGFDTVSFNAAAAIEWLEVQFSTAVDVSFIDVDDASNFDRRIWAAGAPGPVDYSAGLSSAIAGLAVINSSDDATDGPFRHAFAPLTGITSLLIGSAPTVALGSIEAQPRGSQFFITGLGFEVSSTVVPIPAGIWLFGSALALVHFRRRWVRR
ncbi:MAG: hypothetical protein K0U93_08225 [Gammaproteobacteria bacterium]|nr:hypothetical protein [Gammaproteobacteria bacterium]